MSFANDVFTDTDGVLIDNHTPTSGGTWSVAPFNKDYGAGVYDFAISGNKLVAVTGVSHNVAAHSASVRIHTDEAARVSVAGVDTFSALGSLRASGAAGVSLVGLSTRGTTGTARVVGAARIGVRGLDSASQIGQLGGAAAALVMVRGLPIQSDVGYLRVDTSEANDRARQDWQREREDEEALHALEVIV